MVRLIKYDAKNIQGPYGHIPALSGWSTWHAALRRPHKNDALGFVEHVCCQFEACLDFFSKSGHSVQMAMPARRASRSCAQRRAVSPEVFRLIKYHVNNIHGQYGAVPALGGWSTWPAALRRPQKNDAPGMFKHVYCQFSHILSI